MQKTKENRALVVDVLTEARRVCLLSGGRTISFVCAEGLDMPWQAAEKAPEKQTEKAAGGE